MSIPLAPATGDKNFLRRMETISEYKTKRYSRGTPIGDHLKDDPTLGDKLRFNSRQINRGLIVYNLL